MRKIKKQTRKYLIGAGQINSRYQLERYIRPVIINSNPNVPIVDVKLRYCGKNKMFNVGQGTLLNPLKLIVLLLAFLVMKRIFY